MDPFFVVLSDGAQSVHKIGSQIMVSSAKGPQRNWFTKRTMIMNHFAKIGSWTNRFINDWFINNVGSTPCWARVAASSRQQTGASTAEQQVKAGRICFASVQQMQWNIWLWDPIICHNSWTGMLDMLQLGFQVGFSTVEAGNPFCTAWRLACGIVIMHDSSGTVCIKAWHKGFESKQAI